MGKNERNGCENGKEEGGVIEWGTGEEKGVGGGKEWKKGREGMEEGEDRRVWRMEKGEGRREEEGEIVEWPEHALCLFLYLWLIQPNREVISCPIRHASIATDTCVLF